MAEITKCPKCGSELGYYENLILAIEQQYDWHGNPVNANDKGVRGGRRKYCTECRKDVTNFLQEQVEAQDGA